MAAAHARATPADRGKPRGLLAEPSLWVRHQPLVATALVCLVGAAAFASALWCSFAFDDVPAIIDNRLVHGLARVGTLWTTDYWAGVGEDLGLLYRPLVLTTFAINYALSSTGALPYHAVNVALHLLVSLVLYVFARDLGLSPGASLVSALIFVVHPIHTEAVTGLVGRAELLMALGVLLGWLWYRRGRRDGGLDSRFTVLSCGAFAVGLFSKEQAVLLPVLLFVSDLGERRLVAASAGRGPSVWKGAWRRYRWHGLVLLAYLLLRMNAFRGALLGGGPVAYLDNPLVLGSLESRLATALKVAGKYLLLMVWPARLSADYSYDAIPLLPDMLAPAALGGLLAWMVIVALGFWGYLRGRSGLLLGASLCVVTFLPVSNLPLLIGTIMGERLFYLPSAGLCLMLAGAWDIAASRVVGRPPAPVARWASMAVVVLVVGALGTRTYVRNLDWRDNRTLFRADLATTPASFKLQVSSANLLIQDKRFDEALPLLERARAAVGDILPEIHVQLGKIYEARGHYAEAEESLRRAAAVATNTQGPQGQAGFLQPLGAFLLQRLEAGQADPSGDRAREILRVFERAAALSEEGWGPDSLSTASALNNLAAAYASQKRYDAAERLYRRALAIREQRLGPDDAEVGITLGNLGKLYATWGRYRDAEPVFSRSVAILEHAWGPTSPELAPRLEAYAEILDRLDRSLDALPLRMRARAIRARAGGG